MVYCFAQAEVLLPGIDDVVDVLQLSSDLVVVL